ncbi:glycoside hydrolase family 16 protein [Sphingomonas sp. AR_OL41]|uniref:glycoside hydrolase family 16 protein n=1 Tax=Sphingomonas sp. AR_OL41 TaxID=3042729 RepID=UPI0024809C7A|nr:glycoside hydrolase family 16 protein [Sphingomonas sp. AR_OL41]MDH7973916.1 glycoside hydrolase family 16 protein [Sphingomonas sp. AR_OL41]
MKIGLTASAGLCAIVAVTAYAAITLGDAPAPQPAITPPVIAAVIPSPVATTNIRPAASAATASSEAAAAPASVPAGYTLAYADEFNAAALNTNDWYYRIAEPYAGGYVRSQNVSLDGASLRLKFGYEDVTGDNIPDYTGGGIMSRNNFGYGYYEIRARLFNGTSGLHSSFWSMGIRRDIGGAGGDPRIDQDIDAGLQPEQNQLYEIDAFEHDSPDRMGIGDFKQSTATTAHRLPYSSGATLGINFGDWNVYAFDYTPASTKFYINGVLKFTIDNSTNGYVFTPQTFWLTAIRTANAGNTAALPGYSEFDYFRYYNRPQIGANLVGNGSFDATPVSTFALWNPPAWIENYDKAASYLVTDDFSNGTRSLIQTAAANFTVTTKQNLKFIPNGTYRLTARVKSSGGQSQAAMRVLNSGVAERKFDIPATASWTLITIDNIAVTNGKATVAFTSIGAANQWLKIDDVQFVQLS